MGPNVVLRGKTTRRRGATVDAGCVLDDARIGRDVLLKPYTLVTRCEVGTRARSSAPSRTCAPTAWSRPAARRQLRGAQEDPPAARAPRPTTSRTSATASWAPKANIGAGTIFCNYDGFRKHVTTIEEGAFVGSNSSLVAPVTIGKNAYVGSGSVVTRDVPDDALAVGPRAPGEQGGLRRRGCASASLRSADARPRQRRAQQREQREGAPARVARARPPHPTSHERPPVHVAARSPPRVEVDRRRPASTTSSLARSEVHRRASASGHSRATPASIVGHGITTQPPPRSARRRGTRALAGVDARAPDAGLPRSRR
jgi:hypothetical protein